MKNTIFAACALLLFASQSSAAEPANVTLQVIETDPANRTELHYDEAVYLRIAYSTDRPVRIFTRPFLRGERATTGNGPTTHAAPLLPAGSGETLGWFSYRGYAAVDEVRVTAVAEDVRDPVATLSIPMQLYWDDARSATPRTKPAWVATLNAAQQQALSAYVPPSSNDLWLGELVIMVVFAVIVAGIGWPIWAWRKWRGYWQLLAGLPLAILGFWILVLIVSWVVDPTSHNLWPFELAMWAAGTFLYMAIVASARWLRRSPDA
ncbi:MAG TPA: hypothetical protein VF275_01745 [Gammaproteobacteria bacterium]